MSQQIEKQKMDDESAKDPVFYFDPHRIPIEVWNNIFQNCSGEDLLNLSLVCKMLYETNGYLPEAMNKIKLSISGNIPSEILNTTRNYANIKLTLICGLKKFISGLVDGSNLSVLEMDSCSSTENDLINVLGIVRNLSSLKIIEHKILKNSRSTTTQTTEKSFKLEKLEKLTILEENNGILQVILDYLPDTVLEVAIKSEETDARFFQFLERQTNLKCLNMCSDGFLPNFDATKINFKLENLKVALLNSSNDCENFYKFLKSQAATLKSLDLFNISFTRTYGAFENLPQLQKMEIGSGRNQDVDYAIEPTVSYCPLLKRLHLNFSEEYRWLNFTGKFQSVKEFVFNMERSSSPALQFLCLSNPDVKKLVFKFFSDHYFDQTLFPLTISLWRILELVVIGNYYGNDEYYVNKQVKDIFMKESIIAMKELKVLKLRKRILLSSTSLVKILLGFKKLKHLEVDNGAALNKKFLCKNSNAFKNLRFLKITNMSGPIKQLKEELSRFPNLKYSLSTESVYNEFFEEHGYFEDGDEDNNDNDTNNFDDYSDSTDAEMDIDNSNENDSDAPVEPEDA